MGPPIQTPTPHQREEQPPAAEDEEQGVDATDSPHRQRAQVRRRTYEERLFRRNVSTVDEVMDEATGYVTSFIADRMEQDGYCVPDEMRASARNVKRDTANILRQIGDDLESNQQLNCLLSQMTLSKETAFETFASIAADIFSDGKINWGRVVAVIYFGYRMAVKVLFEGGFLKTIIKWIIKFIYERLAQWIVQSGGWDTCKSYLGSTSAQMVGVFIAGCALTAIVFWLKK